jgi:hypothetical protein
MKNHLTRFGLLLVLLFAPQLSNAISVQTNSVDVSITSITSPIERGNDATVKIKTTAGAKCTITVTYSSGKSQASGLERKTANAKGKVHWTWTVGGSTKAGKYPVDISCKKSGAEGTASTKIKVKE